MSARYARCSEWTRLTSGCELPLDAPAEIERVLPGNGSRGESGRSARLNGGRQRLDGQVVGSQAGVGFERRVCGAGNEQAWAGVTQW